MGSDCERTPGAGQTRAVEYTGAGWLHWSSIRPDTDEPDAPPAADHPDPPDDGWLMAW